jgi:hypothetical protein
MVTIDGKIEVGKPGQGQEANSNASPKLPQPVVQDKQDPFTMLVTANSDQVVEQVRKREQPYIVEPAQGITAERNKSPFPTIVENGMNMTPESILAMGQGVANRYGKNALVVPNHTQGFVPDIRNCVAAAFSDKRGIDAEYGAASHLAAAFVARLDDSHPVVLNCYSQGTLISENVLCEMRRQLIASGQKERWDSFAARVDLQTYGAAMHVWPSGIKAKEYRHAGDGVAVVGDIVSLNQRVSSLVSGQGRSAQAEVTILPVFQDAHSITLYLDNAPRFHLKSLRERSGERGRSGTPEQQGQALLESLKKSEFSNFEFERMINALTEVAGSDSVRIRDSNNAILLSREILTAMQEDSEIAGMLSESARTRITGASFAALREVPKQRSIAERRQRPGSRGRF